ncbi:putative zinc-binding metallopeptidase [Pelagicoccus sp. SDUM812003]|uniref:zinc-binding metallopeptidase family protein n=1 Tax=Pelagicoccus sp. SDUM812003 TaxID=3041267 RepID=UPI00280EA9ED|nr:putative zinc-binding metallopeptidase [Pelagicoccus sp. SDUM812003]MDQ8201827.1 putative zinc-binding metallopeptidase [Pelagicoccus sp. SDUM812003]
MKNFYCATCGSRVFFSNSVCLSCGTKIGFDLKSSEMVAVSSDSEDQAFKPCQNYSQHGTCNWAIKADSEKVFCRSCELTETIPDLSLPENKVAWAKLEEAKRRLVFNLDRLGLKTIPRSEAQPDGLCFRFLADSQEPDAEPVLTGHASGVVTINIVEANDSERERRRAALGEPYRTLVGHMRHEVGHYFWDLLVGDDDRTAFRDLFGDETIDYGEALKKHYQNGPPADWPSSYISSYATAHAWEDWAETWAHYLHMMDSVGTAYHSRVRINRTRKSDPYFNYSKVDLSCFDSIITAWPALACTINSFNRSLGMPDAYPFVTPPKVVEKLRFIHELVAKHGAGRDV